MHNTVALSLLGSLLLLACSSTPTDNGADAAAADADVSEGSIADGGPSPDDGGVVIDDAGNLVCVAKNGSCSGCPDRLSCAGEAWKAGTKPEKCCGLAYPKGFESFQKIYVDQAYCNRCGAGQVVIGPPARFDKCNAWCQGGSVGTPSADCVDCATKFVLPQDTKAMEDACTADAECAKYRACVSSCP